MPLVHNPALLFGRPPPWGSADEALAARVVTLLETRPGTLPWEPEFGCDLDDLVGAPATSQRLSDARWRVAAALSRWLPDLTVTRCEVAVVRIEAEGPPPRGGLPTAEAALLSLGVRAALEIDLSLETPGGSLALQAVLQP